MSVLSSLTAPCASAWGVFLWLELSAYEKHNQVNGGVQRNHSHQPVLQPLRHHFFTLLSPLRPKEAAIEAYIAH